METIICSDPDSGLGTTVELLKEKGHSYDSRNGPVLRFPFPVCLAWRNPRRRLSTSSVRDANPFFHLFETMWMFAGLDTLEPLLLFNKGMAQYSDDGKKLRGTAYGHRWRKKWGDQLLNIITRLQDNPMDRRIVMSMWDPVEIFQMEGKDFACNLQVMFSCRKVSNTNDKLMLDMTVTNRSNDIVYGAIGSNVFHFSMLHEYIAAHAKLDVGTYYQISNNLHLYTENPTSQRVLEEASGLKNFVSSLAPDFSLTDYKLTADPEVIRKFVMDFTAPTDEPYLAKVAQPMAMAYRAYKHNTIYGTDLKFDKRIDMALTILETCESKPLREAGKIWLERRRFNLSHKQLEVPPPPPPLDDRGVI